MPWPFYKSVLGFSNGLGPQHLPHSGPHVLLVLVPPFFLDLPFGLLPSRSVKKTVLTIEFSCFSSTCSLKRSKSKF